MPHPDVAQRNPSLADSRLVFIEQIKKKRGVGNSLVQAIFRTGVNDVVMQIANRTEFFKLAEAEAQNGRTRWGPDNNLARGSLALRVSKKRRQKSGATKILRSLITLLCLA